MRRLATALLLGWLLAPAGLLAQGGGLAVLVVDQNSRPIEGAQGQIGELRAFSGADGLIRFPALSPGRYQLITRFIGYRPDIREVVMTESGPIRLTVTLDPTPLHLPPVVVEATRPGIYGIISTNRLEPLPGAEVFLMGKRGRTVRADSAGHFMHPAATGPYLVRFSARGYEDLQLSVTVPEDGGRELLVHLSDARPGYRGADNRQKWNFRELSSRLARSHPRNVLTRADLDGHRFTSICNIPQVRTTVAQMERVGAETLIDGDFTVPNPCGIRAHQVQIIEWGPNVCATTPMGFMDLFGSRVGGVRSRAERCPPYLKVWTAK